MFKTLKTAIILTAISVNTYASLNDQNLSGDYVQLGECKSDSSMQTPLAVNILFLSTSARLENGKSFYGAIGVSENNWDLHDLDYSFTYNNKDKIVYRINSSLPLGAIIQVENKKNGQLFNLSLDFINDPVLFPGSERTYTQDTKNEINMFTFNSTSKVETKGVSIIIPMPSESKTILQMSYENLTIQKLSSEMIKISISKKHELLNMSGKLIRNYNSSYLSCILKKL